MTLPPTPSPRTRHPRPIIGDGWRPQTHGQGGDTAADLNARHGAHGAHGARLARVSQ